MVSFIRMEAQSDVWSGGDEPVELLRCYQCPAAESVRVYDPKHDRKATPDRKNKTNKPNESEEKSMTKTMNIEGMMCGHCEARVKKALEALDAVSEAAVSHESGTAVVTLSSDISDEKLKETVEAEDYKVTSIQ